MDSLSLFKLKNMDIRKKDIADVKKVIGLR